MLTESDMRTARALGYHEGTVSIVLNELQRLRGKYDTIPVEFLDELIDTLTRCQAYCTEIRKGES